MDNIFILLEKGLQFFFELIVFDVCLFFKFSFFVVTFFSMGARMP